MTNFAGASDLPVLLTGKDGASVRWAFAPAVEQQLRRIVKTRAIRREYFDAELFADPAWDILLDLYAAELAQQRVSVSKCCLGANVPATTALRHIESLSKKGLIVRSPDPLDARRTFVSLSESASAAMQAFLSASRRIAAS